MPHRKCFIIFKALTLLVLTDHLMIDSLKEQQLLSKLDVPLPLEKGIKAAFVNPNSTLKL